YQTDRTGGCYRRGCCGGGVPHAEAGAGDRRRHGCWNWAWLVRARHRARRRGGEPVQPVLSRVRVSSAGASPGVLSGQLLSAAELLGSLLSALLRLLSQQVRT